MVKFIKKYREMLSYIIVGGFTTIVSLASYYACVLTFLDPNIPLQLQLANIISWIFAVLFAFCANRKMVFRSDTHNIIQQFIRFLGARLTTLVIDMASMAFLVSLLKINDKVAKIIVQFIVFVLNYIFSKFFVFKSERNKEKEVE